jgi:hypothetical protein
MQRLRPSHRVSRNRQGACGATSRLVLFGDLEFALRRYHLLCLVQWGRDMRLHQRDVVRC